MWSINKGKIGLQKIIYDCMTAGRVCPYSAAGFMGS